uniref:Transposase_23 domain-containing protein n=1 Tax=Panagrellus redivivus TaxID=6233 RepID=A0A7E4VGK4_PANRE
MKKDVENIHSSHLAPWQKLDAVRMFVIPQITFHLKGGWKFDVDPTPAGNPKSVEDNANGMEMRQRRNQPSNGQEARSSQGRRKTSESSLPKMQHSHDIGNKAAQCSGESIGEGPAPEQ